MEKVSLVISLLIAWFIWQALGGGLLGAIIATFAASFINIIVLLILGVGATIFRGQPDETPLDKVTVTKEQEFDVSSYEALTNLKEEGGDMVTGFAERTGHTWLKDRIEQGARKYRR